MSTHRERKVDIAGVRDGKSLGERRLPRDGVGHVELEVIGVRLEGLGRIRELIRHRSAVLGELEHAVLVDAGKAVTAHMARPLGALGALVAERTDDGKQDGRMLAPKRGVGLPQVLSAPSAPDGAELGTGVLDGDGEQVVGERIGHSWGPPFTCRPLRTASSSMSPR